jgi:alkylation response protein AidB-like acyl-CoA dehydrogenase
MNFDLNEEQQEIRRTAKEFLGSRFAPEKVRKLGEARSHDEDLWKEISDLGWPGIAIAEDDGGQGLGMVDLAVLLEQAGYACAPSPLLGSAGAALAISAAGSDEQRAEWLP